LKISTLSKKETAALVEQIRLTWPPELVPKVKTFKAFHVEQGQFLLQAGNFMAVQVRQSLILPFLGMKEDLDHFPSVQVDMGAVKFVCNGAKVMRPGITSIEFFKRDGIVIVKDHAYQKALAVGIALVDSDIATSMSTGYIVDNLHYISDKFWETSKTIQKGSA
jgi:predicted RNA-binding protein (TIGR00451 family)